MQLDINFKQFIGPTMTWLLIISLIIAIVIGILLNFHWKEYGYGHPEVKILKYFYLAGSIFILILMLLSVVIYD